MVTEQSNTSKCFLRWGSSEPIEGRWERSRTELEKQRDRGQVYKLALKRK